MSRETVALNHGIELESLKNDTPAAPPKRMLPTDSTRHRLIAGGKKLIGTPYRYGGNSPKGFDCSGLVQHVFAEQGFRLPRNSSAQFHALLRPKDAACPVAREAGGNRPHRSGLLEEALCRRPHSHPRTRHSFPLKRLYQEAPLLRGFFVFPLPQFTALGGPSHDAAWRD